MAARGTAGHSLVTLVLPALVRMRLTTYQVERFASSALPDTRNHVDGEQSTHNLVPGWRNDA